VCRTIVQNHFADTQQVTPPLRNPRPHSAVVTRQAAQPHVCVSSPLPCTKHLQVYSKAAKHPQVYCPMCTARPPSITMCTAPCVQPHVYSPMCTARPPSITMCTAPCVQPHVYSHIGVRSCGQQTAWCITVCTHQCSKVHPVQCKRAQFTRAM
jgi:hypothetical protein